MLLTYSVLFATKNSGKIRNGYCSWSAKLSWHICPVCQLGREKRTFVLEGVCVESLVDAMFVMVGPTEFLGYITSRIIYSEERKRWEILNSGQVLAFMKTRDSERDFPLGVNLWTFLDTSCTDPGLEERSLSLHLDLEGDSSRINMLNMMRIRMRMMRITTMKKMIMTTRIIMMMMTIRMIRMRMTMMMMMMMMMMRMRMRMMTIRMMTMTMTR